MWHAKTHIGIVANVAQPDQILLMNFKMAPLITRKSVNAIVTINKNDLVFAGLVFHGLVEERAVRRIENKHKSLGQGLSKFIDGFMCLSDNH